MLGASLCVGVGGFLHVLAHAHKCACVPAMCMHARIHTCQMPSHADADADTQTQTDTHTHTCFDYTRFTRCLQPHSRNFELGRDWELHRGADRNTHVDVWIARGVDVGEVGKGDFNGLFRADAGDEGGPIGVHHVHLSLAIGMVKFKCAREERKEGVWEGGGG